MYRRIVSPNGQCHKKHVREFCFCSCQKNVICRLLSVMWYAEFCPEDTLINFPALLQFYECFSKLLVSLRLAMSPWVARIGCSVRTQSWRNKAVYDASAALWPHVVYCERDFEQWWLQEFNQRRDKFHLKWIISISQEMITAKSITDEYF